MEYCYMVGLMLFLHTIADYNLQGWLASAKQKDWWTKNAPDEKYRFDYIMALFMHSFQWTFLVMLPLIYYAYKGGVVIKAIWLLMLIGNTSIHMMVDDTKANQKTINLVVDQLCHIGQILVTALVMMV